MTEERRTYINDIEIAYQFNKPSVDIDLDDRDYDDEAILTIRERLRDEKGSGSFFCYDPEYPEQCYEGHWWAITT